jgi:hypothetical protein
MAVLDFLSVQYFYMDKPVQATSPEENNNEKNHSKKDNSWITTTSIAIFILLSLGVVVFIFNQNQKLKNELAKCQTVSTPVPVASQSPTPNSEMPLVSSPSANTKIVSPLKVTGKVPAGWMNEGVFPIKLMDSKNKILAQGVAKEKVAGSWQSGKAVEFVTTLIFKTATGAGTLVLQNDNPSGLPENDKIFEFPINF